MDSVLQPQYWTAQYRADEQRRAAEAEIRAAREAAGKLRPLSGQQALAILMSRPKSP